MDIKQIFVNGETHDIKDAAARTSIEEIINPEFDDSGTAEGITSFPSFLEKFKSKYNLFQWFRDFKAGAQFILHSGQIINNCVTDRADLPGSAAQLKVLMDLYTQLNSNLRDSFSVSGSILDYALTVTKFQYVYIGENTTDLPAAAKYAIAKIYERAGACFISIEGTDRKLYLNYYNGSAWKGWETCVTNSNLFTIKDDYTITEGYVQIADSRIRVGSRILVNNCYIPGKGAKTYIFTVQAQNGNVNIYIRNSDGTMPLDEETVSLLVLVSNGV